MYQFTKFDLATVTKFMHILNFHDLRKKKSFIYSKICSEKLIKFFRHFLANKRKRKLTPDEILSKNTFVQSFRNHVTTDVIILV